MKRIPPFATTGLLAAIAMLLVWLPSVAQADQPQPKPQTQGEGWEILFDGTSTDAFRGWKMDRFPEKGWVIEGDALHIQADSKAGDIVTKKQYANFDLRFEWKVAKGSNSGVIYRCIEHEDVRLSFMSGPEYQILEDQNHRNGKNPKTTAASLYAHYAPNDKKTLKPIGEWNTGRVVARGSEIEHWLNGEIVVAYDLDSDEFQRVTQATHYKQWPKFAKERVGHIAFQDHTDDVWFRNIRIKTLPDGPAPRGRANEQAGSEERTLTPEAPRVAEVQASPEAIELLGKIEAASARLETLHARVRYKRVQSITGDEQVRFGDFYYRVGKDAQGKDTTRFAVLFDRLKIDEKVRPMQTWYVFDGNWLLERDHDSKQATRRELVPQGAEREGVLSIGDGKLPIYLRLKADRVLSSYAVQRLPDEISGDLTLHRLRLIPKASSDGDPIDLWFNRQTMLLYKTQTTLDGDPIEIVLPSPKPNADIPQGVFDTTLPDPGDGWQVQDVPLDR